MVVATLLESGIQVPDETLEAIVDKARLMSVQALFFFFSLAKFLKFYTFKGIFLLFRHLKMLMPIRMIKLAKMNGGLLYFSALHS